MKRVVIIGGGITGLATAYFLARAGIHAAVLEAGDRPGGVIRTERVDGYLIEGGPDSLLAAKPWGAELCRDLGIELTPVRSGPVYVLARGRLEPLPPGMMLTVPARIGPFLRSPLISPLGKLRMAMDLVLPRGPRGDESLGAFVERRLGREARERIAEPLMAGIYLADADQLSLEATFPRLIEMERESRSLMLAARRLRPGGGAIFEAPREGMGQIVEALASRVEVRCSQRVMCIEPGFQIHTERESIAADAVVVATPAHAAAAMLGPAFGQLGELLGAIPYVSSTNVSLAFRHARVPAGTGFVVPRGEGRRIVACTWSSQKFDGRAPDGHLLLRCFMVGEGTIETARDEVRDILGINEEPVAARRFFWPAANPIYQVGHLERVRRLEASLPAGLHLAGSAYHGVGVPDCIRDARRVAALIAGTQCQ